MSLSQLIERNGLWNTLKLYGLGSSRAKLYDAAREGLIQTAYVNDNIDRGGTEDTAYIIDKVYEYEDDPRYLVYNNENCQELVAMQKSLAFVFKKAISQGTDLRLRFVDGTIRSKYRVDEGEDYLVKPNTPEEVADRFMTLWEETIIRQHRARGDAVLFDTILYEMRIERNQIHCRVIKQLEEEGLIDHDALFPRGGSHESVMRDVETFDRLLHKEWQADLMVKSEEERKAEYRRFLRHRTRTWKEEYKRWTGARKEY